MVFVLSLMVTITLLTTRLFRATLRLTRQADEAAATLARMDSALEILRADVWSAHRIQALDPHTAALTQPDGAVITWRFTAPDTLTRAAASPQAPRATRAWTHLELPMTFTAHDTILMVAIPDGPTHSGGQMRFVSQLLLTQGAAQ
jgi:hypothetical protein